MNRLLRACSGSLASSAISGEACSPAALPQRRRPLGPRRLHGRPRLRRRRRLWHLSPRPRPPRPVLPTAEEIRAQLREAAEGRQEAEAQELERKRRLEDAWFADDPLGYALAKSDEIYHRERIDLRQLVAWPPSDNPLSSQPFEDEAGLGPVMIFNKANEVNTRFVDSLNLDPGRLSNYEPLYLEALKQKYDELYGQILDSSDPQYADNHARIFVSERFLRPWRLMRQGPYSHE